MITGTSFDGINSGQLPKPERLNEERLHGEENVRRIMSEIFKRSAYIREDGTLTGSRHAGYHWKLNLPTIILSHPPSPSTPYSPPLPTGAHVLIATSAIKPGEEMVLRSLINFSYDLGQPRLS